jgi:hypothetical protein
MDSKLIQARAEIEEILRRHDIAAHVVLHNAPGNSKIFMRLTPGYSKLAELGSERDGISFRLRSKLADYGGDVEAQKRDLAATANMVSSIAMHLGTAAMPMLRLAEQIDRAVGATHTEMQRTEGRPQ